MKDTHRLIIGSCMALLCAIGVALGLSFLIISLARLVIPWSVVLLDVVALWVVGLCMLLVMFKVFEKLGL